MAKAKAKKKAKKPAKHPHVGQPVRWLHSAARGYMSGVVSEVHTDPAGDVDHAVITQPDGTRVTRSGGQYELLGHSATTPAAKK